MMELRRSKERGHANLGWLDSYHSFSFAHYHDPKHMGFGPLRVINDDKIQAGAGFGTHGHKDMEIITYVLEGELEHKDSMGNGSVLRPGDVQRMSAGTGVMHSEFNHSQQVTTHLLQIWIIPDQAGVTPGYQEKHFTNAEKEGRLCLLASKTGQDGSISIHQNAKLYAGLFHAEQQAELNIAPGRLAYVHVVKGTISLNDQVLSGGDALKLSDEQVLRIQHGDHAEVLVFDLPGFE